MTFFEEIKDLTNKAIKEKEEARIEISKAMIIETNDGIRKSASLGHRMYLLPYYKKDCDTTYIKGYYNSQGFNVNHNSAEKTIVISW